MTHKDFIERFKFNKTTDKLGEGGFGKVFKAYDNDLDRWVAIKIAEVKHTELRLKKEVEMVKDLPVHRNVARYEECYTFDLADGEYDFGILQYYSKGNLLQLLKENELSQKQKTDILIQILAGLDFLHQNGIIHRDLKPQNILMVRREDGTYIPKITDFGISKKLDINKSSVFNNSLVGAGTLAYSSPEQLNENNMRKNADIWSFGVIAFQVFTGELPFTTGSHVSTSEAGRMELFRQINRGQLPDSSNKIDETWRGLIERCLVVSPEERIKNCKECVDVLKGELYGTRRENSDPTIVDKIKYNAENQTNVSDVATGETKAEIPNQKAETPVTAKPRKWLWIASGILLLAIVGGIIGFTGNKKAVADTEIEQKLFPYFDQSIKKWGFIDREGREVVPPKYSEVGIFSEGMIRVEVGDSITGYIDETGEEVIPLKRMEASPFSEGLAAISSNNKYGFINKTGKEVIPLIYDYVSSFSGGLAPVMLNNKRGFIDKTGREAIPLIYDNVSPFSEGLAAIRLNNKWGFIDKTGKEIIPLKYDRAYHSYGILIAELNRTPLFFDYQGNEYATMKEAIIANNNLK